MIFVKPIPPAHRILLPMKLRSLAIVGASAVLAVAAVVGARLWWGGDKAEPAALTYGEVEVRVAGPGTVQARVALTVSARVAAQVVSLHVDHGDFVKRGQLLAVLDDREAAAKRAASLAARESVERGIAAAEASLAKAASDAELARSRQRRDAELARSGFISAAAFDASALGLRAAEAAMANAAALLAARRAEARMVEEEARFAQAQWSHTRVHAPMDGLVIQRAAEPGATVGPGSPLLRLVDPATLWVAARIDEALVGRIAEGARARIRLRSGGEYEGRVARISRQSDAATRELEVNVAFDVPPARFSIDQEAQVSIHAGVERGPAVPLEALVRRDGSPGVLVARGGRAVFEPVRVLASDGRIAVIAWTSR